MKSAELPAGWIIRPLSEVAEVKLGRQRSPKNHSGPFMRPYLRAANVTWAGLSLHDVKEMNFGPSELETFRLEPGDLLVAEASGSRSEVGKAAIWRGEIQDCCFQNTLLRVRSRGPLPEFLLLVLRHAAATGQFGSAARGVGIHHLGAKALSEWPVILPTEEEQREIVAEVDKQMPRLDAAFTALRQVRVKLRRYRTSVLNAAFKSGLMDAPMATSVTLSDVAELRLGKMLSAASRKGKHPLPYIRNINVRWRKIETTDLLAMDFAPAEVDKFRLRPGDVLVCEGGEPGRAAVWEDQLPGALFQKAIHRVRPRREVLDPYYLVYHLYSDAGRGRLDQYFTGSTIKHFTGVALKRYQLSLPPLKDQQRVVTELDRRFSLLDGVESTVETSLRRTESLRLLILSLACSGRLLSLANVDVELPAMEPITE